MIQIDIDMPKSCDDCPFHRYHSRKDYVCVATPLFYPMNLANYKDDRKDFCPLKEVSQEPILDKIRAEIFEESECAYADFERYKVEYLGQDWEDVLDSLPQDDFRYGMERAIEIIDKYKGESEG